MKKMNLIVEGWRKFLNEAEEQSSEPQASQKSSGDLLTQVKEILSKNPHTSALVDKITDKNIVDNGETFYVNFPEDLDSPHMSKHFNKENPGSVWSIGKQEVNKLILDTLKKAPTFKGQEGPAFKFKWMNQQSKSDVGYDSLVKVGQGDSSVSKTTDLEKFGMVDRIKDWAKISDVVKANNYELVTQDGNPYTEEDLKNNVPGFLKQEISVKQGDKMSNPTKIYNLITAKVGEVNGKPLLTLMTIFPGMNPVGADGKDILNKKDLAAAGYALLKPSTQVKENKMKITKQYLKQVIKEELSNQLQENDILDGMSKEEICEKLGVKYYEDYARVEDETFYNELVRDLYEKKGIQVNGDNLYDIKQEIANLINNQQQSMSEGSKIKVTKQYLKQVIKEELQKTLNEEDSVATALGLSHGYNPEQFIQAATNLINTKDPQEFEKLKSISNELQKRILNLTQKLNNDPNSREALKKLRMGLLQATSPRQASYLQGQQSKRKDYSDKAKEKAQATSGNYHKQGMNGWMNGM